MMTIDVSIDSAEICGQRVERPTGVSRSEWLELWEAAQMYLEGYYFTTSED